MTLSDITDEPVLAAARALHASSGSKRMWEDLPSGVQGTYIDDARTCLEAAVILWGSQRD